METYTSEELYDVSAKLYMDAKNSVVEFMKSHNLAKVDMTLDKNGLSKTDDYFDEDWYFDNKTHVVCWDKHGTACNGVLTSIELKGDTISAKAEDEEYGCEFNMDYIQIGALTYISILSYLEKRYSPL